MEEAILKVGLPVKCAWGDCKSRGFVKPQTDYGGWVKRWRRQWYCPKHAKKAKQQYDNVIEQYKTPVPEPTPADTEAELYKLLD